MNPEDCDDNLVQIVSKKWSQCIASTVTKAYENKENVLMLSYGQWNRDHAQSRLFLEKVI